MGSHLRIVVEERHDRSFIGSLRLIKLLLLLLWHLWLLAIELLAKLWLTKRIIAYLHLGLWLGLLNHILLDIRLLAHLRSRLGSIRKERVCRRFGRVHGRWTLIYSRALEDGWTLE